MLSKTSKKSLTNHQTKKKTRCKDAQNTDKPKKPKKPRKPRTGPSALDRTNLEEETVEHEVSDGQKVCSDCGGTDFVDTSMDEVSTVYTYYPAKLVRVTHKRKKCKCKNGCTIVTADGPAKITPRSRFSPSLTAHIMASRSFDAIPFHRQSEIWSRAGVPLSPQTITNLFHDGSNALEPLHTPLLDAISESHVIHADETPQPVLSNGKTKQSYIWTFATQKLVAYVHSASRSGELPQKVLQDSIGVLVADGYGGYNKATGAEGRVRAGCLAHGRRKLLDAESEAREEIAWAIDVFGKLYAIEREIKEDGLLGTEAHHQIRQEKSRPLMNEIKLWVANMKDGARPKSKLYKACVYFENQWHAFQTFLDDPNVPLDNNHAERVLRRIALARKTSFFVGSDWHGKSYAFSLSLIYSCRLNGIDPEAYLTDVLPRIKNTPEEKLRDLLPDRWKPPE